MKAGIFFTAVFVLALGAAACAQDATPAPPAGQAPDRGQGNWRRGGGPAMGPGRGLEGTVTAVAADHYTIKTDAGDLYTVNFSVNTRILKQPAERHAPGQPGPAGASQPSGPQPLQATDIKVGDPVIALGQVDSAAKTVGALAVLLIDPERAKQLREMQANFGKTWLQGKVTAVNGVSVTLSSSVDNATHIFVANDGTAFRKHREPITLADVQVGDMMRVEGALKDGSFVATTVIVMGMPPGSAPSVPRDTPPTAPADAQPK